MRSEGGVAVLEAGSSFLFSSVGAERRLVQRATSGPPEQDSHLGEVADGVSVRDPSWAAVGALGRNRVLGRLRRCEAWLAGSRAAFASGCT